VWLTAVLTTAFLEVLQPLRYLQSRPKCFRLEREFAGSDSNRQINCTFQGTHNNRVENAIRPIALGRRNWLFAGSELAGQRAAAIMSLIATAKHNGHDPHAYLKDVLTRLPTTLDRDIANLLPHHWQPAT
jgi:hypothetical protein